MKSGYPKDFKIEQRGDYSMKQRIFHQEKPFWQKAMREKTYEKSFFLIVAVLILSLVLLTASFEEGASAQEHSPRKHLPKSKIRALPAPGGPQDEPTQGQYRLIVKFRDDLKVRAHKGSLVLKKATAESKRNILEVTQRFGMSFSRLTKLSEEKLKQLEDRAVKHSRKAQPDLAGIMIVHMQDTSPGALEAAAKALQVLDEVEFSYIQTLNVPPPGDILPPTPLHQSKQTYRGPNPGMNVDYAWSQGYKGAGIKISVCEYGWVATHEDLNDINLNLEQGQTIHSDVITKGWDSHGTAVIGMTSGVINNYGVSGMSPDATIYTYPEWTVEEGYRRTTAILNAIANSNPGDVVLLEMQTSGHGGYVPAEYDPAVWTAVKTGTDLGVIVVGAAGNGNQNLDSQDYDNYMQRGDSGAIIVGAGSNTFNHNKLGFSTYGSRVNLQGWGTSVFTLGYGHFAEYAGDKNQRYTDRFGGTSSASPFVASACAIIQQAALDLLGHVLTPLELRDLLIQTGVPQISGGHIGPFPDLKEAIAAIDSLLPPLPPPSSLRINK
jgi:hypothetical protein